MNRVARTLLVVGALVLTFLIGVLVGRGQRSEPATNAAETASAGVQINTAAPPPTIQPLPATPPPPAPKRAEIPKLDPNAQVNADAAAVGMTTTEEPAQNQAAPANGGAADSQANE